MRFKNSFINRSGFKYEQDATERTLRRRGCGTD